MAVVLAGIILLSLSFQVIVLRLSMPPPRVVIIRVDERFEVDVSPDLLGPVLEERIRNDYQRRAAGEEVPLEHHPLPPLVREEASIALVQPRLERDDVPPEVIPPRLRHHPPRFAVHVPLERRKRGEPVVRIRGGRARRDALVYGAVPGTA